MAGFGVLTCGFAGVFEGGSKGEERVLGRSGEEEVKVAALVGLEDVLVEEAGVAAGGGFAVRRELPPGGEAAFDLGVGEQQVNAAAFDV